MILARSDCNTRCMLKHYYSTTLGKVGVVYRVKKYQRIGVCVSPIIYQRLKNASKRTGYTMNCLINVGIVDYLVVLEKDLEKKGL